MLKNQGAPGKRGKKIGAGVATKVLFLRATKTPHRTAVLCLSRVGTGEVASGEKLCQGARQVADDLGVLIEGSRPVCKGKIGFSSRGNKMEE